MQGIFRERVMPVALRVVRGPEQVPARAATQLLRLAPPRYVLRFPPTATRAREEMVAWPAPTVHRHITAPSPREGR